MERRPGEGYEWQRAPCGEGFRGQTEGSGLEGEVRGWDKPEGSPVVLPGEVPPSPTPTFPHQLFFIHIKLGLFPFICLTFQPRCC